MRPWGILATIVLLAVATGLAACSSPPATDAGRLRKIEELYAGYTKDFPTAPAISPQDAVALWREGKLLPVDVRSPEERQVSVLPGSVSERDYLADPGRFAGKEAVAVCTIGYRSGVFTVQARDKGLPVRNLAQGLLGWLHAGGSLVDPA